MNLWNFFWYHAYVGIDLCRRDIGLRRRTGDLLIKNLLDSPKMCILGQLKSDQKLGLDVCVCVCLSNFPSCRPSPRWFVFDLQAYGWCINNSAPSKHFVMESSQQTLCEHASMNITSECYQWPSDCWTLYYWSSTVKVKPLRVMTVSTSGWMWIRMTWFNLLQLNNKILPTFLILLYSRCHVLSTECRNLSLALVIVKS